ncbi:hypothetical protein EXN66_Car016190 [Channa argus]|uniref:Uncharacterized protein n=1 Tax=Channa argus TaxID=215402 RepID=A0A6G1QDU7_CHAAH|nr:hypothetical protein EXN66_Car016190 [Channa argus]
MITEYQQRSATDDCVHPLELGFGKHGVIRVFCSGEHTEEVWLHINKRKTNAQPFAGLQDVRFSTEDGFYASEGNLLWADGGGATGLIVTGLRGPLRSQPADL